jgi:hypothetical protein
VRSLRIRVWFSEDQLLLEYLHGLVELIELIVGEGLADPDG